MYTVRVTHYPAPGKAAEMRAALEEHSKASNAEGSPHNLAQPLYASEPAFVNGIRHESLAALEAYTARNAGNEAYRARTARFLALDCRPPTSALYENLLMASPTGDVNYALHRTFYPAPGKVAELRKALEQRAKTPSPGSVGKAVSALVLGPDSAHFMLTTLFSSLAGYEQYLKAQPADPGVQAFAAQVATLTSAGGRQQLHRVLVRFTDT